MNVRPSLRITRQMPEDYRLRTAVLDTSLFKVMLLAVMTLNATCKSLRMDGLHWCSFDGEGQVNFWCPVKFWDRLHHPSAGKRSAEVPLAANETLMVFSLYEYQRISTRPEIVGHCMPWRAMFVKLFVSSVLDCDLNGLIEIDCAGVGRQNVQVEGGLKLEVNQNLQ